MSLRVTPALLLILTMFLAPSPGQYQVRTMSSCLRVLYTKENQKEGEIISGTFMSAWHGTSFLVSIQLYIIPSSVMHSTLLC